MHLKKRKNKYKNNKKQINKSIMDYFFFKVEKLKSLGERSSQTYATGNRQWLLTAANPWRGNLGKFDGRLHN